MRYTKTYIKIFKSILVSAVCLLLLAAGACSGGNTNDQDFSVDDIPLVTLPPVIKEPVPKIGGDLTFPIPENPLTINPLKVNNVELQNLLSLIYEQPVRIATNDKAIAELAETWSCDPAGTVWTFKLRKGVKWQNGYGSFTADDIIFTAETLLSYSAEESRYAVYNDYIISCVATDSYTVTVTLTEPSNIAVYFMTMPVLCKAYLEEHNIDEDIPVGTGPYTATLYDKHEGMDLVASEVWWKQPPYIQNLKAVCYSDHETELIALDSHMLDFVTTSILAIEPYIKYGQTESRDYQTRYYDCIIPNVNGTFLSDINIRLAIAYGLDKRDIISKALLGHAVATDYPVPLGSFLSGGSSNIYEFNQQKAIELLGEAGWKNLDKDPVFEKVENTLLTDLEMDLLIYKNNEDTYRRDVAENIVSQLLNCGILINIEEVSYTEYTQRLASGSFELALCSFYLDSNPDPTFMIGTGGTANFGRYSDSQMDNLLSSCRTAQNDETMAIAYIELENYFVQQAPHIGLYFRTNSLIYDSTLNIKSELRDLSAYTTIPKWYIYVEEQ